MTVLLFLCALIPLYPSRKSNSFGDKTANVSQEMSVADILDMSVQRNNQYAHQAYITARMQLVIGCFIALVGITVFFTMATPTNKNFNTEICFPGTDEFGVSACHNFDGARMALLHMVITDGKTVEDNSSSNLEVKPSPESNLDTNQILSSISQIQPSPKSVFDDISLASLFRSIGILFAIESVAFFLLRDYRRSLTDLKGFERQTAINTNTLAAYKIAKEYSEAGSDQLMESLFAKILAEDLLIKLKDGETTERLKLSETKEGSPLSKLLNKLVEKVSFTPKEPS